MEPFESAVMDFTHPLFSDAISEFTRLISSPTLLIKDVQL
jgi:hypothetical protein